MTDMDERITSLQLAAAEATKSGDIQTALDHINDAWTIVEGRVYSDWQMRLARNGVTIAHKGGDFAAARIWLARLRPFYDAPGDPDPTMEYIEASIDHDAGEADRAHARFAALLKKWGKRPFREGDPRHLAFALAPHRPA